MALAVTHVIVTIIILDLLRHYAFGKKKFPRYLLVIGGIAGLLPDIDIPLGWLVSLVSGSSISFHGGFTHSYLWVVLLLVIGSICHWQKKMKWAKIFYVIAAGCFLHLGLDWLYGDYKALFWPLTTPANIFPNLGIAQYRTSIDAIILIVWLVHEEIHKKIKDYI